MRDLGPGCALAVNDAGLVAGRIETGELATWQDSAITRLGVKGNVGGINAAGVVVGSLADGTTTRAFVYANGAMTTLPGEKAAAINSHGAIAGTANGHAFLYQGGVMRDLGTLGGNASEARGLNDRGQVVGMSTDANGQPLSFLDDGAMSALPAPAYSSVAAINGRGQVVGSAEGTYGYLVDNGAYVRLDTLPEVASKGWRHLEPTGINDQGWIVGTGTNADGNLRAFLLIPATERIAMRTASACGASSACRSASMPR
jgi:probable HAF family extracellular repeat protein